MNYNGVDEKAEVLKDSAKKYITDAMGEDVEIPEEVIEAVSVELLQELEGKENVTAEDIKDIFDRYAKQ
jgi:DnaJ-class molecular chaperone